MMKIFDFSGKLLETGSTVVVTYPRNGNAFLNGLLTKIEKDHVEVHVYFKKGNRTMMSQKPSKRKIENGIVPGVLLLN